ncbi:MAG: hypothetical protein DSY78_12925 [Chloroflexi bacterium]|jgi:hypothetical protein|nr:hypothetical protein [Dehalococcoidia bacterium]RUA29267.1 MAG: hypothetical protein DSY78_12925 [Chloroflexota bacterium]|tara:strand:+ start:140 stop:1105 length:966 start_codon:yes stop_codon:yes gene_type:complete
MMKPAFEIRMVKENLDLSMALLQAVQEQKVTARQLFREGPEDMFVAFAVDNDGPDQAELTRRAANQARAAFALAVIQTQRSLDRVFTNPPLEEKDSDLSAARCVMFLLNNTVFANLFTPVWNCPPEYRRRFEVRPINLLIDAGELHGKQLSWDHVGGLRQFIDLLVYFANWAEDLTEIEQPAAGQNDTPAARWESVPEDDAQPEIVIASPAPARMIDGAVARFVDVQCDVSNGNLVLAKELYEGFQAWCRNTGQDDVSQRSFGMQLTAMGFQRRRRGRGKHWWDGIRLVAAAAPLIGETLVERSPELTNGHYEGYQAELPT